MESFRERVVDAVAGATGLARSEVASALAVPPRPEMGDFAFPCFVLARTLGRSPVEAAREIAGRIEPAGPITAARAVGPYVNLFLDQAAVAAEVLRRVHREERDYGHSREGLGKIIVIDFSSPNIAKPFNIGHIRSTAIGHALYNIHEALGYECVGVNHLGDWGTQFGKLIAAFRRWGSFEDLVDRPIHKLLDLYVRFHRESREDPSLEDEARAWFKKLEDGDPEATDLWSHFRDLSLAEFQRIYGELGVTFDAYTGESFYNDRMGETVRLLESKGLARRSEQALVVDLEEFGMPPCLLRKADDATLYATRDLAALLYRKQEYGFEKCLYVVGAEQTLHFRQIFKVLDLMGYEWARDCHHVPFGLIRFKDEKMSTREGNVVFLDEVLRKSVDLVREIIREKNPELPGAEEVARAVGVGAVVFNDLKNRRIKDVTFAWEDLLNFDGRTGPYLQYTHARICSILRKHGGEVTSEVEFHRLSDRAEAVLVRRVASFPERIRAAAAAYEPSVISEYLLDLAEEFNSYYGRTRILIEGDAALREARVLLAFAVKTVLAGGLKLLGLEAPEEM